MALPTPYEMFVEIAPGANPDDPASWAGLWVDITPDVRQSNGVSISAGRRDEGTQVDASTCTFWLNNRHGVYSPDNAESPYWPDLTESTPIRVRWGDSERFVGNISELPLRWDKSGNDAYVPVRADGIMRRMRIAGKPLNSAMRRFIDASPSFQTPAQYWPLEEPAGATQGGSVVGQPPLRIYENEDSEDGSVPVFGRADLMPPGIGGGLYTVGGWGASGSWAQQSGSWSLSFWINWAPDPNDEGNGLGWVIDTPGSTADRFVFSTSNQHYQMYGILNTGVFSPFVDIFGSAEPPSVGLWPGASFMGDYLTGYHHIAVTAELVSLPNTWDWFLYLDGEEVTSTSVNFAFAAPATLRFGGDAGISHLIIDDRALSADDVVARYEAGLGFPGETAGDRMVRLCDEEATPFTLIGNVGDTRRMGPQRQLTLLELLSECELADGGALFESGGSLAYRTRTDRYNQAVTMALDVAAKELAETPEPTRDDQNTRNAVSVTRDGGSTIAVIDSDHIARHGRYEYAVTINVASDDMLTNTAAWLVHLGTYELMRWPLIGIALHARPELLAEWTSLSSLIGQRMTIEHAIEQIPGVEIDLLVEGWHERIDLVRWEIQMNCVPAQPWDVFEIESATHGRIDTGGSELNAALDNDDTSFVVDTLDGPRWIDSLARPGDFPFDVIIGGEVMNVSTIVGTTNSQTFTVTRSVNGITKSHDAGTAVRLYRAPVIAL